MSSIIITNICTFTVSSSYQNLKSHAVTMFEVGKLSDETLDSFLAELEKVRRTIKKTNVMFIICVHVFRWLLWFLCLQVESTAEGEAQRYFDHALTLKNTILFLRYNKELTQDQGPDIPNIGSYAVALSVVFFIKTGARHHAPAHVFTCG